MLEYYAKTNYGQEHFYLADNATADLVTALTSRKTITQRDLNILATLLGVQAREVIPPRSQS